MLATQEKASHDSWMWETRPSAHQKWYTWSSPAVISGSLSCAEDGHWAAVWAVVPELASYTSWRYNGEWLKEDLLWYFAFSRKAAEDACDKSPPQHLSCEFCQRSLVCFFSSGDSLWILSLYTQEEAILLLNYTMVSGMLVTSWSVVCQ